MPKICLIIHWSFSWVQFNQTSEQSRTFLERWPLLCKTMQDHLGKAKTSFVTEPWTKGGSVGLDVFVFTVQATSHTSDACSLSSSCFSSCTGKCRWKSIGYIVSLERIEKIRRRFCSRIGLTDLLNESLYLQTKVTMRIQTKVIVLPQNSEVSAVFVPKWEV